MSQGIALMTGQCDVPADTHLAPRGLPAAVMQGAEATLLQYRLACQQATAARPRAQRTRQRLVRNLAQQIKR